MSPWIDHWLPFLFHSSKDLPKTKGIDLLNPYSSPDVRDLCQQFYRKYYGDEKERTVLLGINPGRLGAGVTGISFTDPDKLETICGLPNDLEKKEELSSRFIYQWIRRISSPSDFYQQFILLAVCPLGFISNGKNVNYYDDKKLQTNVEKLIIKQQNLLQTSMSVRPVVFMLGKGKNYRYFKQLNDRHGWYQEVIPLPHPRWVMQYRFADRHHIMDEMTDTLMSNTN